MIHIVIAAEQPFAVGASAPASMRRAAQSEVTLGPIRSDGRTDSEADSFALSLTRVGADDLFWPLPIGARVSAYQGGDEIVTGVLVGIAFGRDAIELSVQL